MQHRTVLIEDLWARSRVPRDVIDRVLTALAEAAADSLARPSGRLVIPGVCKIRAYSKAAVPRRQGRNPFTGEPMMVGGWTEGHRIRATLDPVLGALERKSTMVR